MQRQRWFEIHDSRWFPAWLRDLVTEALESVWIQNRTYRPIAARLRDAVRRSGSNSVVDLCSGSGGPWLGLWDDVAGGEALMVHLTDRYPNSEFTRPSAVRGRILACAQPVDARAVPANLRGFRTMFSSFHHFDPNEAQAILADAFGRREGIAVFEAARREKKTMALLVGVPLLALRNAAVARPVRWKRILFTWVIPAVPAILLIDGWLSCLRSYSLEDLGELTARLQAADYAWEVGEEDGGIVPIRFLIGTPIRLVGAEPLAAGWGDGSAVVVWR